MSVKRFLIAVDLQNDFVTGSLGTKEAQAIIPAAAARIEKRRREGYYVIATMDTHDEDYPSTVEGRKLPVTHCLRGTEGWALAPDIAKALEGCPQIHKPTFGSVQLASFIGDLAGGAPEEIELIGLCTDICVVSNALLLKAHYPNTAIAVVAECCAGVTPQRHEAALETMRACHIDVI